MIAGNYNNLASMNTRRSRTCDASRCTRCSTKCYCTAIVDRAGLRRSRGCQRSVKQISRSESGCLPPLGSDWCFPRNDWWNTRYLKLRPYRRHPQSVPVVGASAPEATNHASHLNASLFPVGNFNKGSTPEDQLMCTNKACTNCICHVLMVVISRTVPT